jgi:hypothetical protein
MGNNGGMISRLICIALCLYAAAVFAEPSALPDQYGQSGGLDQYPDQALLVIVASGRKLRWIGRWEEQLRAELPQLVSLRVADIKETPRPSLQQVATKLRKHVPENVSILIDLDNAWASEYQLDTDEPCLLILDQDHGLIAQYRGRPKTELVNQVLSSLRDVSPAETATASATP